MRIPGGGIPPPARIARGLRASSMNPVMPSPSGLWGSACACTELGHGEHVAFAVFEPGRLTDRGDRNAVDRAKARLVVLLELNPPAAQLCDLRLQVLDNPGGELMLGGPGARGENSRNWRSSPLR